jgi:hypothetical protein
MSKDFAKEYKDAVVNDLPDLWDRIEAALPEDVNAQDDATTPVAPIEFKKEEKPKKKKKKLVWLYAVIPAAAIILVVLIPVGALLTAGIFGLTTKQSSNSMAAAAPAAASDSDSIAYEASEAASFDEDPSFNINSVAEAPESIDSIFEDDNLKGAEAQGEKTKDLIPEPVLPGAADTEEEQELLDIGNGYLLANAKMKVKVDGTYTDDAIGTVAELQITSISGKNNEVYDGFSGFSVGECVKAKPEGFDNALKPGVEYEVSIYLYAPGDYWVIRPAD